MSVEKAFSVFSGSSKGSTINDLGRGRGKLENEFIFSTPSLEIFLFLQKDFLQFPGEGPSKNPPPQIISGRPLMLVREILR